MVSVAVSVDTKSLLFIRLAISVFMINVFLQDSPEVHANAAETLCAITRYAPPGISAKIASSR